MTHDPDEDLSRPDPAPERRVSLRVQDWVEAEAALSGPLAQTALAFGALDERLRLVPQEGLRQRLILSEVAELSWHLGDRIPADRLALYLATRLSGARDDASALLRAGWAVRRLGQVTEFDPDRLAMFLGRAPDSITAELGPWQKHLTAAAPLHPLCRAALAWHSWRSHQPTGDANLIEGAVAAAAMGGRASRGGLGFLPVALSGGTAYAIGGPAQDRLHAWLISVESACLRGLMICDQVSAWEQRATEAIADLSGRTPPRLIRLLATWPMLSAPMAETLSDASRASVQRNLITLNERGLLREVTGQSRFRFWEARL